MSAPDALRRRVLERVEASHRRESRFVTVRRQDSPSEPMAEDVRIRHVCRSAIGDSSVVELAPFATWRADRQGNQVEIVVTRGSASLGEASLQCGDIAVMPACPAEVRALGDGVSLYLRTSNVVSPSESIAIVRIDDDGGWTDLVPGVKIRALWDGGERQTMLVRMAAGASVKAHGHALEEECMMLAGEAFVGDTLLRCGDFQLAPQGTQHGEVSTDVGALLFVHGALDPADYL